MKNINFPKLNFFTKIFLFFIIIASFLFFLSILSTQYYLNYLEKNIEDSYQRQLFGISGLMDKILKDTYSEAYSFAWSDNFSQLRNTDNPEKSFPNGYPGLGIQIYSYVHSIFYIHRKSETIIGRHFTKNIDEFFDNHYPNLPPDRIKNLNYNNIFSLTEVTKFKYNDLNSSSVIPFFIYDKGKKDNVLLVNINQEKLSKYLKGHLMTQNSNTFFMDNKGQILANTENIHDPIYSMKNHYSYSKILHTKKRKNNSYHHFEIKDKKFISKVKSGKPFRYNLFGEKKLIITSPSMMPTFQQAYYISYIPYKDLYIKSIPIGRIAIIVSLLSLICSLMLSFFISKSLYSPIKKLISLFKTPIDGGKSPDEFSFISKKIKGLLDEKETLSKNLTIALPMIAENYLFKVLNENVHFVEDQLKTFLEKNKIFFKNPNFLVSLVRLNFGSDFYKNFDREQQLHLINETYRLFKNAFKNPDDVYILTIAKNEICIILNIRENENDKDILKSIQNIIKVYKSKENFIEILCGSGRVHYGLKGLQASYKEACIAASSISPFSEELMKIYNPTLSNEEKYYYSINEENQLINYLLSGFDNEAVKLINDMIKRNFEKGISLSKQKALYIRIYHTCIRALNRKDLSEKNIMEQYYKDITQNFTKMTVTEISEYLLILINNITSLSSNLQTRKFNVKNIISFINNNYTNDISLENLAFDCGISTPHLSRLLKESLGMPFQQYLNNHRVKKAKNVLRSTSHSIDEISNECGFNSRFTFIRMFKKLEGITPTQFRNIVRQSIN